MKKQNIFKFLAFLLSFIFSTSFMGVGVSGFNDYTHSYITRSSLKKVKEFTEKSNDTFSSKENQLIDEISGKYKEHIIKYSLQPDIDENQGGYKKHFYNPVTEKNYMGEKDKTALTKCLSHYNAGIEAFKQNNKSLAYEELGRSIHFMEDLSACVHTGYDCVMDSVVKLPMHVEFEKVCDNIRQECKVNIPLENLNYYYNNSLEDMAKSLAVLSMDNFYRLENVSYDNHSRDLAYNCITNSLKAVPGLMLLFVRDAANSSNI